MTHEFDPGYNRNPFKRLVRAYPGAEVYPQDDFRVRGVRSFIADDSMELHAYSYSDKTPRHTNQLRAAVLVGEAGQRVQGLLAKLGITRSYVLVNTFLYSVYGQGGGNRHKDDPAIAEYRNEWLDALIVDQNIEAVISLGQLADHAFTAWLETPSGKDVDIAYATVRHPTYPESASAAGSITKAEAFEDMLHTWNAALRKLKPAIKHPDEKHALDLYGSTLEDADLAPIPEMDLPAGLPEWMRSLKAWASRQGEDADLKRATIQVRVPTGFRP